MNIIISALFFALLAGCGTFDKIDTDGALKKIEFGKNVVYLNKEFSTAYDELLSLPFSLSEREAIAEQFDFLSTTMDKYSKLDTAIVSASEVETDLDNLAAAYFKVRNIHMKLMIRENQVATSTLRNYDAALGRVYDSIKIELSRFGETRASNIVDLLSNVARIYFLFKTGGVTSVVSPQPLGDLI